jgi:hypothetical protein
MYAIKKSEEKIVYFKKQDKTGKLEVNQAIEDFLPW